MSGRGLRTTPEDDQVTVEQGDGFKLISKLDDSSVDLLLTSPPYWGLRSYGHEHDPKVLEAWKRICKRECKEPVTPPTWDWYRSNKGVLGLEPYPEWYVAHLAEFFQEVQRVLKPKGSLWLNLGDTYFARWSSLREDSRQGLADTDRARRRTPAGGWRQDKQLMLIPARVAIALQETGWILRNDVVWRKTNTTPRPKTDRLRNAHEHFFHFVKKPARDRASYYYELGNAEDGAQDVVDHPVGRSRDDHFATFPESIVRARVLTSCPPGGLVCDPFCGTGRTLEVAVAEGRRALGFELSEDYARAAQRNAKAALDKVAEKNGTTGARASSNGAPAQRPPAGATAGRSSLSKRQSSGGSLPRRAP